MLLVTVDPEKLAALDLSMSELAAAITSEPLAKQVVRGVPLIDLAHFEATREGPSAWLDGEPVEVVRVLGQGCEGLNQLLAPMDGDLLGASPDDLVLGGLHPEHARMRMEALPEGVQLRPW